MEELIEKLNKQKTISHSEVEISILNDIANRIKIGHYTWVKLRLKSLQETMELNEDREGVTESLREAWEIREYHLKSTVKELTRLGVL